MNLEAGFGPAFPPSLVVAGTSWGVQWQTTPQPAPRVGLTLLGITALFVVTKPMAKMQQRFFKVGPGELTDRQR
jgi:hypothetical protein